MKIKKFHAHTKNQKITKKHLLNFPCAILKSECNTEWKLWKENLKLLSCSIVREIDDNKIIPFDDY